MSVLGWVGVGLLAGGALLLAVVAAVLVFGRSRGRHSDRHVI